MTKDFNEDDFIQDPGPLHVPYVEMRIFDPGILTNTKDYDLLWRRVKTWFDSKFPRVLWMVGRYDKDHYEFQSSRIYFQDRKLYVEFCQTFPEFLRGEDES